MGPFWNYCLLVLLGGFVTTIATQTTIVAVIMVAAEGRGCPIPNVLCTTGLLFVFFRFCLEDRKC
jgi:hypothetical protein